MDFWLDSKYGYWQKCQKKTFKRHFPSYIRLFVTFSDHTYFILSHKLEKIITEKKKTEPLKSIY